MKRLLGRGISIVALLSLAFAAAASQSQSAPDAVGTWRGTSLCLVRPSPCNDERVVYRITRIGTGDTLSLDARKIVNGTEEEMGVLACLFARAAHGVTCTMANGNWVATYQTMLLDGTPLFFPVDGDNFSPVSERSRTSAVVPALSSIP